MDELHQSIDRQKPILYCHRVTLIESRHLNQDSRTFRPVSGRNVQLPKSLSIGEKLIWPL
jgi:hypothetical protein